MYLRWIPFLLFSKHLSLRIMDGIGRLPPELILYIAKHLEKQQDISSFTRCSWKLYNLLHRYLCRFNSHHHKGSAFIFAAENGYTELVTRLLEAGASIGSVSVRDTRDRVVDEHGALINPLIVAIQNGHMATLAALLDESRPGLACSPVQLRAALHWVLRSRRADLFEIIIAKDPPLGLPDGDDEDYDMRSRQDTALGVAITVGCDNAVIERLLQQGAHIEEQETPCPWYEATVQRGGQMLDLLIKYGHRPKSDRVLSLLAMNTDDPSTVKRFTTDVVDWGMDIHIYRHIALFTAVDQGHFNMVKFLIENGANPNLTCEYNNWRGPFNITWIAVQAKHFEILEYLVVKRQVQPDRDALEKAREMKFDKAICLLSGFSYKDIAPKLDIPSYIAILEEQSGKKPSPNFHATPRLPCACPVSEPAALGLIQMHQNPLLAMQWPLNNYH